jgi:excisionase family DNA binding protein
VFSGDERMKSISREPPLLLTADETALMLRTSKKAIYAMVERGQLPGVVRIGRRVLLREADLVEWLRQNTHAVAGKD